MIKSSDTFVSCTLDYVSPNHTTKTVMSFVSAVLNRGSSDKVLSRSGEIIEVGVCTPLNRLIIRYTPKNRRCIEDRRLYDEIIDAVKNAVRTKYHFRSELVQPILVQENPRAEGPLSGVVELHFYIYFL